MKLKSGEYVIGNNRITECNFPKEVYMEFDQKIVNGTAKEEYQKSLLCIMAFTLTLGLDKFITVYSDLVEFTKSTTLERLWKISNEVVKDPENIHYITNSKGVLYNYLFNY
jgi:hypothetical protein